MTASASTPSRDASRPAAVAPVEISADVPAGEWDAYVHRRPDAACYHLYGWRQVFERAFGHTCVYLAARRAGALVGILPLVEMRSLIFGRFMVSLPFVNYGGVLADDEAAARALADHALALAREHRLSHVELRHFAQRFPDMPAKRHKVTMLLPLGPDVEAMWTVLDRKVRNQVRKAEKCGLVCETGGRALVDAFYPVFATNMRDLGTPVYAKRFFEEVFAAFPGKTTMFVVRTGTGMPVAAGIGLAHRDAVEMPWASSLKAYLAMCPNNLLYWSAIQHAIAAGARTFDFGRSTPHEGTYHFKAQWGAEAQPLCWEYGLVGGARVPDQSPKNPKFSAAIEAWKRLPLALAGALGPKIVRSIP